MRRYFYMQNESVGGHWFQIIKGVALALGLAQLDFLGDGDGFDHVEDQTVGSAAVGNVLDALFGPNLTGLDVVDGRDDGTHAGNLTDILQSDRIAVTVPTEGTLHRETLSLI